MAPLLMLVLEGWGLSWFVARSAAFAPIRDTVALLGASRWPLRVLDGLLRCAACSGFWTGIALAWIARPTSTFVPGDELMLGVSDTPHLVASGLIVMGANAMLDVAWAHFATSAELARSRADRLSDGR